MQQFVHFAGLLILGLTLIVPSFAAQEKKDEKPAIGKGKNDGTEPAKKDDKKDAKDKDEPKEKLSRFRSAQSWR